MSQFELLIPKSAKSNFARSGFSVSRWCHQNANMTLAGSPIFRTSGFHRGRTACFAVGIAAVCGPLAMLWYRRVLFRIPLGMPPVPPRQVSHESTGVSMQLKALKPRPQQKSVTLAIRSLVFRAKWEFWKPDEWLVVR